MTANASLVRSTALVVLALVALRLIAAAVTPITFDEAYYWLWSKHPALSYYDHPPMVALVIRAGTMIGGDTAFGIRVVSILLALPMSWAVFRSAETLFDSRQVGATATLLLNATLLASVGTMIVTPDAPLLVASSFVLFGLAKVQETGKGVWWLAVGAATGVALLSKYSALFFGVVILIWLLVVPAQRRWFASPWPYLGGAVAFLVFSPVIIWNAGHGWVSFIKQMGRARVDGFRPAYVAELLPTQFAFATPLVFVLGVMGLVALTNRKGGPLSARVLLGATVGTIIAYFTWHALHARVEANWLAPIYPAFAIAAAAAAHVMPWGERNRRTAAFCRRWAVPGGIVLFVALILQANTGWLSGYRRDATVRSVGVGWTELAAAIEAERAKAGATCVLAPDYGTTSWLAFYLPPGTCVAQQSQRYRWSSVGDPDATALAGPLLYVDEVAPGGIRPHLKGMFDAIERLAELPRRRGPLVIETYALDLLKRPTGDVLDRAPPPELAR